MQYRKLKGTGLMVSNLSVGTMMFGNQVDEKEGVEIINYALDNGINFIDTANIYNNGLSETITGIALKGRRDEAVLSTKIRNNLTGRVNDEGLSRVHMISAVEACLKRLDTDYIDILYFHAPDYCTPIEETMETAAQLVRAGKTRYIGISNYASWQIVDLIRVSEKINGVAPVVTQNGYNLVTRSIDRELVPCIKEHNIALVVYSPLAGGLLTEKHLSGKPVEGSRMADNKLYSDRFWKPTNLEAARELNKIAAEAGMDIASLAMNWCNSLDYVDSITTGMSNLNQFKQNIACLRDRPLDVEIMEKCDAVWERIDDQSFKYNR